MKVFSNTVTYNYSWDEVSTANWQKYGPWNNKSEHVVAVDTLSRSVDPATGILRTERLITCKQSAPEWMKSLIGGSMDDHFVYEASYVDPANKTLTMVSQNLTWNNLRIKNSIEDTLVNRFRENAVKGKEGFERVLEMSRIVFAEEKARQHRETMLVQ
uniref:PRELI/MSF1 domain-containing protein n=1 Tax=Bionectria ochroleuca TaxID=29856 RepID=A0A0B7JHA6_BIOOC